jgi:release factor glutamine methyltransferase
MSDRLWTVKEILDTARRYLEEKTVENPRGSAEALLGKALNLPRIELYLQHDRPLTEAEVSAFRELLRRRVKHEPLQLILGSVDFAGARIEVQPGVLIPRPETEELIEQFAAQLGHEADFPLRLLDLGTGSGCVAVALAKRYPRWTVDAVDSDFEAVRLTWRNAQANGVGARVRAILGDLFSPRFEASVSPFYDALVSNPPYVSESEYESLAPEIRHHEPKHALLAGEDGLAFYRRLAVVVPQLLTAGGKIMLEIGGTQGAAVRDLFKDVMDLTVEQDSSGHDRFACGTLRSK